MKKLGADKVGFDREMSNSIEFCLWFIFAVHSLYSHGNGGYHLTKTKLWLPGKMGENRQTDGSGWGKRPKKGMCCNSPSSP